MNNFNYFNNFFLILEGSQWA